MRTINEHTIEVDGMQRKLFFLRGHMRSGTNWTCELLNQHPDISCKGEYHFLRLHEPLRRYADRHWLLTADPDVVAGVQHGFRETIRQSLATHLRERPGASCLGDRTPEPLEEMLPGASIIHIVRDGRDVLVSYMFHRLRQTESAAQGHASEELRHWQSVFRDDPHCFAKNPGGLFFSIELARDRIQRWAKRIASDRDFIKRCQMSEANARVLSITYERLHAKTSDVRDEMYRFLGLDPARAKPIASSGTAVAGFGDRGEQPDSFFRAGRVGDWRTYFTPEIKQLFEEEAGPMLRLARYERSGDWVSREETSAVSHT